MLAAACATNVSSNASNSSSNPATVRIPRRGLCEARPAPLVLAAAMTPAKRREGAGELQREASAAPWCEATRRGVNVAMLPRTPLRSPPQRRSSWPSPRTAEHETHGRSECASHTRKHAPPTHASMHTQAHTLTQSRALEPLTHAPARPHAPHTPRAHAHTQTHTHVHVRLYPHATTAWLATQARRGGGRRRMGRRWMRWLGWRWWATAPQTTL